MRHRRRSRVLGRSPSHRKALLKNLASAIFLTERDAELDANKPKIKGRIVTTLHKAKEVRSLVEKTITIAKKALIAQEAAGEFATTAERQSDAWKAWRKSDKWQKWAAAMAPVVNARRRCIQLLGDKQAVKLLFSEVAPRFKDRLGGYTRVLRLAKPRLGDAGVRGILEFTGVRDRKVQKSEKPAFDEAAAT
jgi:large subunit ribosomal protein L17